MDLEVLCESFTLKMLQRGKAQYRRAVLSGDRSYRLYYMGQIMRKRVLCHMRTTKGQISLRIRAVSS